MFSPKQTNIKNQQVGLADLHFNDDFSKDAFHSCFVQIFNQLGLGDPQFDNLQSERLMSAVCSGRYIAGQHQAMLRHFGGTFLGSRCFGLNMDLVESNHPDFCSMLHDRLRGQTVVDLGFLTQHCAHLDWLNDHCKIEQLIGIGYHISYPPVLRSKVQGYSNATAIDIEAVEFMALLPDSSISALCAFAIDDAMFDSQESGLLQSRVWIEQIDRILKPGALLFGYDAKPIEDLLKAKPREYRLLNKPERNSSASKACDLFYYRSGSSPLIFVEKL